MKKTICMLLMFFLCIGFIAACGEKENTGADGNQNNIHSGISGNGGEFGAGNAETDKNDSAENPSYQDMAEPEYTPQPTAKADGQPNAAKLCSYTVKLKSATPVHSGPYKESSVVQTVGQDGTYTIVQETADSHGNLWGKLKSGAGWVNISEKDLYFAEKSKPEIFLANEQLLGGGYYERYNVEESEYITNLAFRADNTIKNISLAHLEYNGSGYTQGEVVYKLEKLPEGQVLVLGVVYYGDTTTYGFEFTDTTNETRRFAVSLSGMDGSLAVSEY